MSYLSRIKNKKRGLGALVSTTLLASVMTVAAIQKVQADAVFKYWDVMAKDSVKYMGAPELLSQTWLYAGDVVKPKITNPAIFHYDVNSPLWSDAAHKNRWVYVPNGKKIGFILNGDYYAYPDSTVFIKQFDIDTIPGDTNSRVFWETRLLINKKDLDTAFDGSVALHDHWYGYSYKWNRDQKDAKLVNKNQGLNDTIRFYPNGINQPAAFKKWTFPSRFTCVFCHANRSDTIQGRTVLGFFTAQLNRPHPDSTTINQLEYFFKKGLFSGTKPSNWNDTPSVPKWAGITDSTASLDLRARSYIAANCSGCHGERGVKLGIARNDLNYDFHTNRTSMEFRNKYVGFAPSKIDSSIPLYFPKTDTIMNPNKSDSLRIQNRLVVAGYPAYSMILFRQRARQTEPLIWNTTHDQMPPVATFEVNVPATDLIEKWIKAMPELRDQTIGIMRHLYARTSLKSPTIEGRLLRLPTELVSGSQKIYITNIAGRNFELDKMNSSTYSIPMYLASGLYVIHVGNQTFKGYLF